MIDRDDAERDLLTTTVAVFRESTANDRTMLSSLIVDWAALSPAHRAVVYKVAAALASAAAWRKGMAAR
jgi:hypothetical protein